MKILENIIDFSIPYLENWLIGFWVWLERLIDATDVRCAGYGGPKPYTTKKGRVEAWQLTRENCQEMIDWLTQEGFFAVAKTPYGLETERLIILYSDYVIINGKRLQSCPEIYFKDHYK